MSSQEDLSKYKGPIAWMAKNSVASNLFMFILLFAGAIGNLIDSLFYGVVFSHSYGQIATLFPEEGYAPFFYGHVVDMLQFPLVSWTWPNWVPVIGGEPYTFFEYVFNVADASISIGVVILLFFNKKVFD